MVSYYCPKNSGPFGPLLYSCLFRFGGLPFSSPALLPKAKVPLSHLFYLARIHLALPRTSILSFFQRQTFTQNANQRLFFSPHLRHVIVLTHPILCSMYYRLMGLIFSFRISTFTIIFWLKSFLYMFSKPFLTLCLSHIHGGGEYNSQKIEWPQPRNLLSRCWPRPGNLLDHSWPCPRRIEPYRWGKSRYNLGQPQKFRGCCNSK